MIWLVLALLIACSGLVSASETALFGLSQRTLQQFRRSGVRGHRRVHLLLQSPRQVLMTVLLSNTAINVSIFAVSFVAFRSMQDTHPALATAGGLMALIALVVFGEMVPKALALSRSASLAPLAAALIGSLRVVLLPIMWLLGSLIIAPIIRLLTPLTPRGRVVSTDELTRLVEHSAHDGTINSRENDMLQAVVALGDVSVREVMTPRVDAPSVPIDAPIATAAAALEANRARQLPVHGKDLDDIRGVIHARDVYLNPSMATLDLLKPVTYVPEQVNLLQLLRSFRSEGCAYAVVVDEFGGTAGVVSMEDLTERIIGGTGAGGEAPPVEIARRIDENTYLLAGDASVRAWSQWFPAGEVERRVDTVAGLVLSKLGRLPREGDAVRIQNLTLIVEKMCERRIESVLLKRGEVGDAEEGAC